MSKSKSSNFALLPIEVIITDIMSYLKMEDVMNFKMVNKEINGHDGQIWDDLLKRDFKMKNINSII